MCVCEWERVKIRGREIRERVEPTKYKCASPIHEGICVKEKEREWGPKRDKEGFKNQVVFYDVQRIRIKISTIWIPQTSLHHINYRIE